VPAAAAGPDLEESQDVTTMDGDLRQLVQPEQ
jgi:hypothetical protein